MKKTINIIHGSTADFDKFDLKYFNIKSLKNDTFQFGIYFYGSLFDRDIHYHLKNVEYYMRNKKNRSIIDGYAYLNKITIDTERVPVLIQRMNLDEYTKLCKAVGLSDAIVYYPKLVSNQYIFANIANWLYLEHKNWEKVGKLLVKAGYDGTLSYNQNLNIFSIALWNVDLINKGLVKFNDDELIHYLRMLK